MGWEESIVSALDIQVEIDAASVVLYVHTAHGWCNLQQPQQPPGCVSDGLNALADKLN